MAPKHEPTAALVAENRHLNETLPLRMADEWVGDARNSEMFAAETAAPHFFGCSRRTFTPNIKPSSSLLKRGPPESPWGVTQSWVISFLCRGYFQNPAA